MDSLVQNEVIKLFNDKPKSGIVRIKQWCADNNKDFAKETAQFFYEEKSNLNLEFVGDYLGTDGIDNKTVLESFTKQLNFKEKDYLESLRGFLQSFKLPGEAQKIDRLVESFGTNYYEQNLNGEIKSKDAAYILAYQTIMLNTDLHNPSIVKPKKMTFEQLKNNLKGTNESQNFNDTFLKKMYDGIKAKPFVLNFVDSSPGYEIYNISSQNDQTFKKLNKFLEEKSTIQDVFSKLQNNNLTAEFKNPKTLLNKFTGYEGSVIVKDEKGGKATIQVYKPSVFSRWFLGEKSKIIIQPLSEEGKQPSEQSLTLASQITASFETKVTSVKATYDYLKEDLKSRYENISNPKQELERASSIAELHKNIKEITEIVQQTNQQIPEKPLASKEIFEDLTQAEIGIKPVEILIKSSYQQVKKPKFNSFIEELAWKSAQRKQNVDTPINQNKEPKIQTDNHAKVLEELKQKQKALEDKKKGLEEKKSNSNITREERWKIVAELESINNQFQAIEKEYNIINSASDREKKFDNKNNPSSPTKGAPTAADLQQQGALAAIKRMKEEKIKQQQAEAANQASQITPTMSSGTIPVPPPMPGSGIPVPPPPPSIPNIVKKEAQDIGKQIPQEGDKHKEGLVKAMEAQRKKIEKQNSGRGM
ncbi:T4SS guanine nucleotide exchange effector RalF [Rickettsia akari]|nr:T4SS guanine nucleotide exchange effector RalF [Rickettsia akari]